MNSTHEASATRSFFRSFVLDNLFVACLGWQGVAGCEDNRHVSVVANCHATATGQPFDDA